MTGTTRHDAEDPRIERLLRQATWVDEGDPSAPPLAAYLDGNAARRRNEPRVRRWALVAAAAASAAALVAGTAGVVNLLGAGEGSGVATPAGPDSTGGADDGTSRVGLLPWVDTAGPDLASIQRPPTCTDGALDTSTTDGPLSSRMTTLTNTAPFDCVLSTASLQFAVGPADGAVDLGRGTRIDAADSIVLGTGTSADLTWTTQRGCGLEVPGGGDWRLVLAGDGAVWSEITGDGRAPCAVDVIDLRPGEGAQAPADSLSAMAGPPIGDGFPANADATVGPEVVDGVLAFTIELRDAGDGTRFEGCPSYSLLFPGLPSEPQRYELNCDVDADLDAGGARLYDMRIPLPGSLGGQTIDDAEWTTLVGSLVWSLDDGRAAAPVRLGPQRNAAETTTSICRPGELRASWSSRDVLGGPISWSLVNRGERTCYVADSSIVFVGADGEGGQFTVPVDISSPGRGDTRLAPGETLAIGLAPSGECRTGDGPATTLEYLGTPLTVAARTSYSITGRCSPRVESVEVVGPQD